MIEKWMVGSLEDKTRGKLKSQCPIPGIYILDTTES
jgi:hypothetical protein